MKVIDVNMQRSLSLPNPMTSEWFWQSGRTESPTTAEDAWLKVNARTRLRMELVRIFDLDCIDLVALGTMAR